MGGVVVHIALSRRVWRTFMVCTCLFALGCALDQSGVTNTDKPGVDPSMPFECSGSLLARYPEACNGLDDDCDGQVDEGLGACSAAEAELPFRLCSANCCISDLACVDGQVCHTMGEQGRCDDPCDDGEFRLCAFGCEPKFQECIGGLWASCPSARPQLERCNDLDDDCDGDVDEGAACDGADMWMEELDGSNPTPDIGVESDVGRLADMGVSDMAVSEPVDAEMDAALPPDAGMPTEPSCQQHSQCGPYTLCLSGRCQTALPGRFNIILVSARVDEEIGDSFSFGFGGEPDLFADLRMGDTVIGSPTDVEDNVYAAVWNHRVTVELTTQQSISACVWDDDGGLRGDDDLAGCANLSSDGIVEHIRTFRGTRMRPNWASVRPQITSGQHVEDFLIHVDRL